jgi:hypothetical protein
MDPKEEMHANVTTKMRAVRTCLVLLAEFSMSRVICIRTNGVPAVRMTNFRASINKKPIEPRRSSVIINTKDMPNGSRNGTAKSKAVQFTIDAFRELSVSDIVLVLTFQINDVLRRQGL